MWSPPGGELGLGEDPARCAVRETEALTGVIVGPLRFVGTTSDVLGRKRHYVMLWFEADYAGGEARVRVRDEVSELGWFDERSLPEPLSRPFESLLDGSALR